MTNYAHLKDDLWLNITSLYNDIYKHRHFASELYKIFYSNSLMQKVNFSVYKI
jgi:hypothetical protein